MRALLLPIDDEWYAVATDRVREATTEPRPTRIPGAPAGVLGVINIRGEIVALFDTATLVGLDRPDSRPPGDDPAGGAFAVVVHSPNGPAAFTATAMPEVVTLEELLGPSDLPGATARYRLGTRLVVMLDIDALLALARGDTVRTGGDGR